MKYATQETRNKNLSPAAGHPPGTGEGSNLSRRRRTSLGHRSVRHTTPPIALLSLGVFSTFSFEVPQVRRRVHRPHPNLHFEPAVHPLRLPGQLSRPAFLSTPLPIAAPCHAAHLFADADVARVLDGLPSLGSWPFSRIPIIAAASRGHGDTGCRDPPVHRLSRRSA